MTPGRGIADLRRGHLATVGLFLLLVGVAGSSAGQTTGPTDTEGAGPSSTPGLPAALKAEAQRYVSDGGAILFAPLHWDGKSWIQAAAAIGTVVLLAQYDARIDSAIQKNRNTQTDSFSTDIRPLGTYGAIGLSFASLGAGLVFKNAELRDTGRDAVEAELFAAGIVAPLLKEVAGRIRPSQGSDSDEFKPLSGKQSFPSGESTAAFALASVIGARSHGWIVPTIAYACASGVALGRMNSHAHFASDVVAGAFIGTAIGHTVVHRHTVDQERSVSWNLVPVTSQHGGVGMGVDLEIGR